MQQLSSGRTSRGDRWVTVAESDDLDSCFVVVQRGHRACCSCRRVLCAHLAVATDTDVVGVLPEAFGVDCASFYPLAAAKCNAHESCVVVQSPTSGRFMRGRSHHALSNVLLQDIERHRIPLVGTTLDALRGGSFGPEFKAYVSCGTVRLEPLTGDANVTLATLPGITAHGSALAANANWQVANAVRAHGIAGDATTQAWLNTYEQREAAARDLAGHGDLRTFAIPLLSHQSAAVAYAVKYRRMLLADDMGLGKTLTVLAAIEACSAYPAIVLVEPNAVYDFRDEAARLLPNRRVTHVRAGSDRYAESDITLVTHDLLPRCPTLRRVQWRSLVIDEADHYADMRTKRYRAVRWLAARAHIDLRIVATGTPYRNQARDYLALLDILGVTDEIGGRDYFLQRYCNGIRDQRAWRTGGVSEPEELRRALYDICLVRRTAEQARLPIPPQAVELRAVSITNWNEYQRASDDLGAFVFGDAVRTTLLAGGADSAVDAAIARMNNTLRAPALVLRSAQRRLSELGKVGPAVDIIESLLRAPNAKVVLFCNFRDTVQYFSARYGGLAIHGGMDARSRHEAKTRFQSDSDARLIACSIHAAKKNLTLTAATHVVFLGLPWTYSDFEQARKRIARLGQTKSTKAIVLHDARTCDRYDWRIIESKRDLAHATLGITQDAA